MLKLLVFVIALAFSSPSNAQAQGTDADFYRGKTVRFTVGFPPGGGTDAHARLIAPYLARELNTTVIVENQPGAGGMAALNRLYVSEPDGLRFQLVHAAGAALSQIAELSSVRYDLAKFGFLGTVVALPSVWLASSKTSFKTASDAAQLDRPIMWGGSSPIDGSADGAAFTCEALHLKCRIIIGYPGSSEIVAAVVRGEMDSIYVSDASANNYVKAFPEVRVIATMGRKRSRFFPNIPTIFELTKLDDDQAWLFDFHAMIANLGRILVTSPNVPEARLDFLRRAVEKALSDPTLIKEGERIQRYVDFVSARITQETAVNVVAGITSEQKRRVQTIISASQAR